MAGKHARRITGPNSLSGETGPHLVIVQSVAECDDEAPARLEHPEDLRKHALRLPHTGTQPSIKCGLACIVCLQNCGLGACTCERESLQVPAFSIFKPAAGTARRRSTAPRRTSGRPAPSRPAAHSDLAQRSCPGAGCASAAAARTKQNQGMGFGVTQRIPELMDMCWQHSLLVASFT